MKINTLETIRNLIEDADIVYRDPNSGCWLWLRSTNASRSGYGYGYGIARRDGARQLIHRASYEIYVGAIPEGMHVLHRCDNTLCCNPHHLFIGTNDDNIADKIAKGRTIKGEDSHNHKLVESEVREIRQKYNSPNSPSRQQLADDYGISIHGINRIVTNITWKHAL